MISAFQSENAAAFLAVVPPETKRHFQRDFNRRRSTVGEENIFQLWRRHRHEPPGELLRGLVGKAGKNNLIQSIGLFLDRLHDVRVTMTMGYNPPR